MSLTAHFISFQLSSPISWEMKLQNWVAAFSVTFLPIVNVCIPWSFSMNVADELRVGTFLEKAFSSILNFPNLLLVALEVLGIWASLPHPIHSHNKRQIPPRANSVRFVLNELHTFFQMNVCPSRVVQTVQAVNTTANCELQECADSGRWLPTSCVVTICFRCSWGQHFSPGGAGKKSFDGCKAIWLQCAVS